jgi:hypothetical protein
MKPIELGRIVPVVVGSPLSPLELSGVPLLEVDAGAVVSSPVLDELVEMDEVEVEVVEVSLPASPGSGSPQPNKAASPAAIDG